MRRLILIFVLCFYSLTSSQGLLLLYEAKKATAKNIPPLPTDQLYANWDVSQFSSMTFRNGSNVGVTTIKSQVGVSPTLDLIGRNYGLAGLDPQYISSEQAIQVGCTTDTTSVPGSGYQTFGLYGNASLTTAAPYTIVFVCKLKVTNYTYGILTQQYDNNTGFIKYDNSQNKFYSVYNNGGVVCGGTNAPAANHKVLIYLSQDGSGNHEIFTNNLQNRQTTATSLIAPSSAVFQIERDGYGVKLYWYQLVVYNKVLTTLEQTQLLNSLNTKWNIW
jgi:hypothetical protein